MTFPFNNKKNQLQFVNCIVNCHDLLCNCPSPAFHSARILINQLAPELKKEEKTDLIKCLGETTTTETVDVDGIDVGDLEKLFAEDTTGEEDDNR